MCVWAGNLWFLYKETKWFRVSEPSQQGPGGSQPVGSGLPPISSDAGGSLPSYPQSSPFAPPSDPSYMQKQPSRI